MTRGHPGSRTILITLLLFALVPVLLEAQETPPAPAAPPPAKPDPPVVETIPIDSIPLKASEDEARLQDIRVSTDAPDPRVEEIVDSLPSELLSIERFQTTPEYTALDQLSVSSLSNLRFQWKAHGDHLIDWQGRLQRRASALSGTLGSLAQMRDKWIRTRDEARIARAPQTLLDRIDTVLQKLAETDRAVQERLAHLITIQGQVSTGQERVAATLQQVGAAADNSAARLFTLDSPPLWQVMTGVSGVVDLPGQIGAVWGQRASDIPRFVSENANRARFHVLFFGLLVLVMLFFRRHARRLASESSDQDNPANLFDRPLAAALVLSLLATRWIYPYPTFAVNEMVLLALVFPLLRLFPRLIPPEMRWPLYLLAGLFVFDRLHQLAAGQPLLQRLLLMIPGLLGIALFMWTTILRRRLLDVRWKGALSLVMQLAVLALSVALIANLVGAVALARLLTTAVLASAFLGAVLHATVLVLDALLDMLLGIQSRKAAAPARLYASTLGRWIRAVFHLGALALWLRLTLVLLAVYHPLMRVVTQLLARRWEYGQLNFSIGEVMTFALVLTIGYALSRILPLLFEEGLLVRSAVPLGVRATISTLAQFGLLTIAFLIALAVAGVELGQFAIIAGALGVGIGFGLQNLVSNFVSGLILAFERPVEVGDTVQVGSNTGRVRYIGLRASILVGVDGSEVILPNANLISNEVINWSLSESSCRVELPVRVAHGTNPRALIEMLVDVARGQARVLTSPPPLAVFRGFGDSSLDFVLYFWAPTFEDSPKLRSAVGVAVHDALKQAGIEVPFPQRDVNLKNASTAAEQAPVRPPAETATRPPG